MRLPLLQMFLQSPPRKQIEAESFLKDRDFDAGIKQLLSVMSGSIQCDHINVCTACVKSQRKMTKLAFGAGLVERGDDERDSDDAGFFKTVFGLILQNVRRPHRGERLRWTRFATLRPRCWQEPAQSESRNDDRAYAVASTFDWRCLKFRLGGRNSHSSRMRPIR